MNQRIIYLVTESVFTWITMNRLIHWNESDFSALQNSMQAVVKPAELCYWKKKVKF